MPELSQTRISLFFPVYNDEATIRDVVTKSIDVLSKLTSCFEILIVNDGSPDASGKIADELAREHSFLRVIHHPENLGYGRAVRTGLAGCRYEWICFTDGDDEYDVHDLEKLFRLRDFYDLIITFRYVRRYSGSRQIISRVYNAVLRWLFDTRYRDISTGLRMMRKSLYEDLTLRSDSPFIGAEIAIRSMLKGFRVGEVGIQTFPRQFGRSTSTTIPNILATIKDMMRVRHEIFSASYDLPRNRRDDEKRKAA